MRARAAGRLRIAALALGAASAGGPVARAQSIEPRTLSPAPVGVSFLAASFGDARGGLSVDPSLPLTNPDIKIAGPVLGYARTLDLGGMSGKLDVILPYGRLDGTARFQGQPVARQVQGLGDPRVRLSVTFHGAPAMSPDQFKSYKQDLLIAASVQVGAPLGQYDHAKLLNLGGNRWTITPEIGLSKAVGQWVLELKTEADLFTENDDFFGGHRRTESPIYSGQTHVIYNWPSGAWASIDATYFTGGRAAVDGVATGKALENARAGGTFTLPVTTRDSVKLFGSAGVSARTHNNFRLVGIAWQYRWGAGL